MIVMMAGLPGVGKSTLSRALASRLPGAVLDKDEVRAALFRPPYTEYSQQQDDFCQDIMLQTCGYLLAKNGKVNILLDGRTFSRNYQRERVLAFCRQVNANWAVLECVCAEQTALKRLADATTQGAHLAANRTVDLYLRIRDSWEPIENPKLIVDTDQELEVCVDQCLQYLTEQMNPTKP